MWLVLMGVSSWLKPWGDLMLNAALGIFVSAFSRSSGMAVAMTYGAIIVARGGLWLLSSLLLPMLMFMALDPLDPMGTSLEAVSLLSGLIPFVNVFIQFAGAVLLVWAAILWLKKG